MMLQRLRIKMRKKLHNKRGDSLAEVLIALLISSLALVMLASMITSSANMITKSKAKLRDYYEETAALNTLNAPAAVSGIKDKITVDSATFFITVDGKKGRYTKNYCINREFPNNPVISFGEQIVLGGGA